MEGEWMTEFSEANIDDACRSWSSGNVSLAAQFLFASPSGLADAAADIKDCQYSLRASFKVHPFVKTH